MTGKEYIATQLAIIEIARRVKTLNLLDFIKVIENAQRETPAIKEKEILKKAKANLAAIQKCAETLLPVQEVFDEIYRAVILTVAEIEETND